MLDFNTRRKELRMPVDVLVKRSGIPRSVVVRILRGHADATRFGSVEKVASVLGIALGGVSVDAIELRRLEAQRKARFLRRLTQGTMGLEAQAISEGALEELEANTVRRLLAEPGRKLWSV